MTYYSTGEIAKKLHISVRTLRYYDQIGLLVPTFKDDNGKRFYTDEDMLVLEKITILKMLHLSLEDIGKILAKVTIEQLLMAHKQSLEEQQEALNESLKNTTTLLNVVHAEGDLKWEQLMPLIQKAQKRADTEKNWNDFFSEQEKETLREVLPKMENDDIHIKKWILLIQRVELCLERGDAPTSKEAQIIAADALLLSEEMFAGNEELANKFFDIRKSEEQSEALNLYPIKQEVLAFLEQATQIYEQSQQIKQP